MGFMKFLFWFQSLPQFTVGLAQAACSLGHLNSFGLRPCLKKEE